MSINHLVSFFIASVKNAGKVKKDYVEFTHSKVIEGIVKIMVAEGFIKGYEVLEKRKNIKVVKVELSYYKGVCVIKDFVVVSTPGLRIYSGPSDLKPFYDGLGFVILSTNGGIMTDRSAKQLNVGGELLCKIF